MATAHDAFTDTTGVLITAHTLDSGGTWTAHAGTATTVNGKILATGRARATASGVVIYQPTTVTPAAADYDVEGQFFIASLAGTMGVCARVQGNSAGTLYYIAALMSSATLTLRHYMPGTATAIQTYTPSPVWAVGETHKVRLQVRAARYTVFLDDVQVIDVDYTASQNANLTTAGTPGLYFSAAASPTPSDTNQVHVADWTFADPPPPAAPVNTIAPGITGTAAVGSTLTASNGTWSNSPTGYTYQWYRDTSTAITGATGASYVVQTADAGHSLTVQVTATNGVGSGSATSSTLGIPAAPAFTVSPAITPSGPYSTGQTVTSSTGTASGSPTYAFQWYRGASPITGETAATYTLQVTDEGANISCLVTATNGSGSASASSNTIVPQVTAPITDASFLVYFSGGTGNADPSLSIGGARGGTYPGTLSGLFAPIAGTSAQSGVSLYRVVYIRNTHASSTAAACKAYIEQQFTHSGLQLAVAVPAEGANVTVPALASETTAPAGVTWITATTAAGGGDFGALGPGSQRGLYLRLTVTPGTTPTSEDDATAAVTGTPA